MPSPKFPFFSVPSPKLVQLARFEPWWWLDRLIIIIIIIIIIDIRDYSSNFFKVVCQVMIIQVYICRVLMCIPLFRLIKNMAYTW